MYRLVELTKTQRARLGWAMLIVGTLLLSGAVVWIHFSSLPRTLIVDGVETPLVVNYFNWIPRAWYWKALGYLGVLAASQLLLAGAAIAWVVGEKMTWSRAAFTAFLTWIELVIIFGIVPSEWLNLSQTDLDWSPQKIALTFPPWLMLGNEVSLSFAALKDVISGGYHAVMLGAAIVFGYRIQHLNRPRKAVEKPMPVSPYGRPLIKGGS